MATVRQSSIATKLTWMNLLASSAALLVACAAFIAYEGILYHQSMVESLSIRAQIVGLNSVSALVFNDPKSADRTLSALKSDPHIVAACVYTPDGQPFAGYWRNEHSTCPKLPTIPQGEDEVSEFTNDQLGLVRTVMFQGKPTALVYLQSDLQQLYLRRTRYLEITVAVLLVSLLAAFLASHVAGKRVVKPIMALSETARVVSRDQNYSIRAAPSASQDEIAALIEVFNEMLTQIQQRDEALQKSRDELERRVRERTAELELANRELEAFTYSVSHDLRAPLRHINGFSQALVEDLGPQLDAASRHYLDRIQAGTTNMAQLIDDLLNLARIGRRELARQVTGLDSILKEVLADLQNETAQREIEWKIEQLPFVECDPSLMKQVFSNLLANACKYTRPRKPAVIEVGQTKQNGNMVIFIRDNGVGFSMKYADKLFGVFQRLHRAEDFEGTGVGLATVQRIIHKHGGRIWAEAELDKGATFYFTLSTSEKVEDMNRTITTAQGRK